MRKTNEDLQVLLSDGLDAARIRMDAESLTRVTATLQNLKDRCGYCDKCARDTV